MKYSVGRRGFIVRPSVSIRIEGVRLDGPHPHFRVSPHPFLDELLRIYVVDIAETDFRWATGY